MLGDSITPEDRCSALADGGIGFAITKRVAHCDDIIQTRCSQNSGYSSRYPDFVHMQVEIVSPHSQGVSGSGPKAPSQHS